METIFENSYNFTRELFIELFKDLYKVYRVILILVGIAFVVFGILSINGYYLLTVILFVFAAYFIYLSFGVYWVPANRVYKKTLAQVSENENIFTIQFSTNEIINKDESHPYDRIKRVHETKDMIVLITYNHGHIPVKKDSFTLGTYEDFKKFIEEKCVNAKIVYKQ